MKKLDYNSLNKFWTGTEKSIPSGCSMQIEDRNPHFEVSPTGLGDGRSDLTPICYFSMKKKEKKSKTMYMNNNMYRKKFLGVPYYIILIIFISQRLF